MFEKLDVYQRAIDLAEKITRLTEAFPPRRHRHLADQLGRASLSISLNIAEGNGRWHAKERKNFFWIARGSVFECVPLLELCRREKLIGEEDCSNALKTKDPGFGHGGAIEQWNSRPHWPIYSIVPMSNVPLEMKRPGKSLEH